MGVLKNASNFVVFLHIFIFLFYVISNLSLNMTIPFRINVGIININVDLSLTTIITAIIVALILLAIISGMQGLASGLNTESTKIILKIASMSIMYSIVSLFTLSFFAPLNTFGGILFGILTLIYALGYLETKHESD